MGRLGVIGGHSILGSAYGFEFERVDVPVDDPSGGVSSEGASVELLDAGSHVILHRHGIDTYTPAHRVDHVAHFRALQSVGCDRVLAISSVGGLRAELGVGTMVVIDDFIALDSSIAVFHDDRSHVVPAFDPEWHSAVLHAARATLPDGARLHNGGVYWQSVGPRFETRAEIRFITRFADVVGMTAASECIVAQELGMPYASICVIDNLANGIAETPLTYGEFEAGKRATRASVLELLASIVPVLAA